MSRTELVRTAGMGAAVLLVLLVAGRLTAGGIDRRPEPAAPAALSPATTEPPPSPVISAMLLRAGRHRLAFGAGTVWVANDSGSVNRIDPLANHISATIQVAGERAGLRGAAVGAGGVWVPVANPGGLVRIDAGSNRVVARIPLGRPLRDPVGVATTEDAVWISCCAYEVAGRPGGKLLRVDPTTDEVSARITLPEDPLAVAAGRDQVWVATTEGGAIRIDPASNRVASVLRGVPRGVAQTVAVGAGGVWLAKPGDASVDRLDPSDPEQVKVVRVAAATLLAVGDGELWAVATNDQGVLRIDPADNTVRGGFPVSYVHSVQSIVYGDGAVWVAQGGSTLPLQQDGTLDSVFSALSDPTRRAILERLTAGEATVSQLAEPFEVSLPAVTKHLAVLHHAGLLVDRREGRSRVCGLRAAPLGEVHRWLGRYRAFWDQRFEGLAEYVAGADE
jgi:DNA-binding transcriptional ArsR family regulator/sugar lactone lactonase YvrE